jgi:subtilisin family serine protease
LSIRFLPALGAALALAAAAAAPASAAPGQGAERFIVVLDDGADAGGVAADHGRRHGAEVSDVYRHALRGYAAHIPAGKLASVRADARVKYVEPDGIATITAQTVPYGIKRIGADLSSTGAGDGSGAVSGVTSYVIDTGVDASHPDLNVTRHVNFAGGSNADCNGHGTHVAGTIAARDNSTDVVGVAPGADTVGVKVLNCRGSGSYSGIIAGVDWVTANAKKPAVANMSLGGGASQALDAAVVRSADSGIFYAVAAGNEGTDACTKSPARAGGGIDNGIATIAATDASDRETSWSNNGNCVDFWAPGANILSTRRGGGTTTMSGTSMASPHAAGGAALYLSTPRTFKTMADIETALRGAAQKTGTSSRDGREIFREFVGGF